MTFLIQSLFYIKNASRTIKLRKIFNLIKIVFSYTLSIFIKNKIIKTRPFFLSVEPADFCQLECPECPVGQAKRKSGNRLSMDLFKALVDEQSKHLMHLIFYFQGEPLLHPQLVEMIRYAHLKEVFCSTSTNAQLLNNNNAKEIVLSGLDKIIISIDGTTQSVYESYRVGAKLDRVLKGVEYLNFWKSEFKSRTPFIELQFVVFKSNEHQLEEMKTLAKRLGVFRLSFKSAQLYRFEQGHPLLTSIPRYARYKQLPDGRFVIKNSLPNRCFRAWSGAVISSKGEVLPCCYDKDASHSYGSVGSEGLDSVYNGTQAHDFKRSLLANRRQHEMCRNCTGR